MNTLNQTSRSHVKLLLSTILILFTLSPLHAQKRSLVTHSIDESARVTFRGNVHSFAQGSRDLGRVPDSQPAGTMMLVLGRSSSQQAALDSYVMSASSPGTASYHQWLTPAAFNSRFGASSQDIAAVQSWLEAQGFTVQVAQAGNVIRFSGTIGAVSSAFQTELHSYDVSGVRHIANVSEPSIPAALAPVVRGIAALNDFRPQAQAVRGGHASFKSKGQGLSPELTVYGPSTWGSITGGSANYDMYFLPAAGDAAKIYDTPNTAMNPAYSGATWTGSGVTIGIVGDSNLSAAALSDIAHYRSLFLNETLAQAKIDIQLPKVVVDGVDPGVNSDVLEAVVDVEQAEAFAPKALTTLYVAAYTDLQSGLLLAIQRAVNDNAVSILNISFGECEQNLGAGTNALLNEVYEQAAAEGITITVSAGDSGAAGCDVSTFGFGVGAGSGLAVNGLASTPWNIAVGGTDFDVLYTTNLSTIGQYIQLPSTTSTQAGTAPYFSSALGYIQEEPWNDSTGVFTTYTNDSPYRWGNGPENTRAGGGGLSSKAVCTGNISTATGECSGTLGGYAKPAFQASLTPADSVRDVPDISLFSGSFMSDDGYSPDFNAAWSVCSDNTVNGDANAYTDCVPTSGTVACNGTCGISQLGTSTTPIGGTSTAAPAMAGILALVIQHQGGQRLGQADYGIYNLARANPGVFHDITQGNNAVLCSAGSLNCGANGFIDGYNAGTGYDYATGIGSLDVAKFVNAWSSISFATTTSTLTAGTSPTSLSSSAIATAHGTPVYFKVAVSPANASGNIVLTTTSTQENSDSITTAPISNGVASFSTLDLPAGTYTVYARYGGDTTNAASQSQGIPVTITSEVSGLQFNLNVYSAQTGALTATSPSSAVYGSQIAMDITPFGDTEGLAKGNPATGTVTISQGSVKLVTLALNSEGTVSYSPAASTLAPGKYTFTASYSGDTSYNASSVTQTITITQAVLTTPSGPSVLVLQSPTTSLYFGGMQFVGFSNGVAPTGSFTFSVNGSAMGSWPGTPYKGNGVAAAPLVDVGISVTATLQATIIVGETATVLATYSGDANYAAATYTETVTVVEPATAAFTLTTNGNITIATPGQSGPAILSVTPSNGFGGSVNLTCVASGTLSSTAPTCSIPASVSISGTAAQTVTVTIATTSASAAFLPETAGGAALAALLLFFIPNRRRRALSTMCFAALLLLLLPTSGCGTKTAAGGGGSIGTAAGTYTYTITGVNGAITNSTTLTVIVQ
jgi:subtilase family serine protease